MTGASLITKVAPHEKRHREYLAILRLYTGYDIEKITRLLNQKFKYRLEHDDEIFDEAKTAALWEMLTERNDRVVQWAYRLGVNNWRVKRVKKWAEELE